jgi:hypothetical protein
MFRFWGKIKKPYLAGLCIPILEVKFSEIFGQQKAFQNMNE